MDRGWPFGTRDADYAARFVGDRFVGAGFLTIGIAFIVVTASARKAP